MPEGVYGASRAAHRRAFYECVSDLLEEPEVRRMGAHRQHGETSRLKHSLNVAYYSYRVAKALRLDCRSAARGALLHDLFFYDWKECGLTPLGHARLHPHIAHTNASCVTDLNEVESDIILKHMWLCSRDRPIYGESLIVTLVDKMCACAEALADVPVKGGRGRRRQGP